MFADLVTNRRQMVEQVLLPYLEPQDLVKFAGTCRAGREMLTPFNERCVNLLNLAKVHLDLSPEDEV